MSGIIGLSITLKEKSKHYKSMRELNNNYIGVDVGCTKMYICCEYNGQYIEKKAATGLDCTKEKIKQEIDSFIESLPFIPKGIGMALPGLIEGNNKVKFSDINSLSNVTADYFAENKFEVKFINDVKAATLAEVANYKDKPKILS